MSKEEIYLNQLYASQWSPLTSDSPLRQLISRSTYRTYIGKCTIESFLDLFKKLVAGEGGILSNKNNDIRLYFINSMKTQDVSLECLEELPQEDERFKISERKANLIAMLKGAIKASLLSVADCRLHFSTSLLEMAKVIPSKLMFDRRLIRTNTARLYKQNKFNLLHEDPVGYSALINDIVIGSIALECDEFGRLPPTPIDNIPRFLDVISSHIGNFQLDPNRVLDILLDFFIKEVLTNYDFWIELFKQSVWIRQLTLSTSFMDNIDGKAHHSTTTKHSAVMAHLLGFKFENYQLMEKTPAPDELYYSCALLINSGLIRLGDLLPYLAPNEEHMEKLKQNYMENMNQEIKNNSAGLLAQYGALDEEGSTTKASKYTKDLENEQIGIGRTQTYGANDVVELTKALLSIGDLVHSEELLARYGKLCDMHPVLAHYIYRLCGVILEPAYQLYVPDDLKARSTYFLECAQQSELMTILSSGQGDIPTFPKLTTYYVLDCLMDGTHNLKEKQVYRFFYTRWSEQLETATSYDQLLTQLMPIMRLSGYHAYLAPHLIHKLIQTLLALFERGEAPPDSQQRQVCNTLIREFLLPAISFSGGNPGLMANVWELLDLMTLQERYRLYGEWGNDFYKKSIETKLLKVRVERNVKSVMRHVSKNDVRQCGRDLSKLAHSNPTIVFSVMLDQIQCFDNLAPYMADACRYMSNFSYDILGYLMTEKWTGSQGAGRMKKTKSKEDGITSSWLRALSVFAGMLFKKQGIDPTPLIRYVVFRLQYDDSVADLVLFNEFITKLCGIEIIGSTLTDNQITSSGCCDTLKSEAFAPISNDNKKATKRVITRLKNTLKKDDIAVELLVLLYRLNESWSSQQNLSTRERVKRLNHIHRTILQYYELLTTIFEEAEYSALVPSVDTLYKDYGLPYPAVMQILRPKIRYLLRNSVDSDTKNDEILLVLQPLVQATPFMMQNDGIFEIMAPEFFVIFWQLSLYDIHCPVKHYEMVMKRQTDLIAQCQDPHSPLNQAHRPSVVSKMERQAQAILDALQVDLPKHKQDVENTMKMLKAFHSRWFVNKVNPVMLTRYILQYCLYPRSVISEVDAVYCYKFALLLHYLNVSNFSSLVLIDQILCDSLPTALITLTDYETTIHARFIFKTFSKMSQWYKDEHLFNREAHGNGLIGFQRKWLIHSSSQEVPRKYLLPHSDFIKVMHKWHHCASQFLEQALQSGDSHQIRNAFLILRQFIPHFPAICEHGNTLVAATKVLATTEKRDDLKVLARSYLGLIEKSKSRWVSKNAFMGLPESEPPLSPETTPVTAASAKQRPTSPSHSKPTTPRHHYDDRERLSEKLSTPRDTTSSASQSNNNDKNRSTNYIDSHLSSRSSSLTVSSGAKGLRSDDMEPHTPRPSDSRYTVGNSNRSSSSSSRHHRSDLLTPSFSSRRYSPRHPSNRGADIIPPTTAIPISSHRDQPRDAIREPSSRSTQSYISISSYLSSTKELRRSSPKDERRRTSSRDHHHHHHDEKRSRNSQPLSSTHISSSSMTGHKRRLEDENEKSYSGYSSKSDDRSKSDRRSTKDRHDKKHSRR
ncbi:unnamed protein product [Absidia cylindrospora]